MYLVVDIGVGVRVEPTAKGRRHAVGVDIGVGVRVESTAKRRRHAVGVGIESTPKG